MHLPPLSQPLFCTCYCPTVHTAVLVERECQVVVGMVNGKMVVGGYPSAALH